MRIAPEFWSCDWGTSAFRLRLVETDTLRVLAEVSSGTGARAIYDEALAKGRGSESGRAPLFASYLEEQLGECARQFSGETSQRPLVLSGMASSSIGWKELPYARAPLRLDGGNLPCAALEWDAPPSVGRTWLVSGVASAHDMMRGEETEAIGILSLPEMVDCREESLLLLPGTHSKHLRIEEGAVTEFHTYMTGELFDLLARQSLLKASVDLSERPPDGPLAPGAAGAFREGVEWVRRYGLSRALFRTRTRTVLDEAAPGENRWFLSGVLIGGELLGLADGKTAVVLGGSGRLPELYQSAIDWLSEGQVSCRRVPTGRAAYAAVAGHRVILERYSTSL